MAAARYIERRLRSASPDTFEVEVHDLSAHVTIGGRQISQPIASFYRWCIENFGSRPYQAIFRWADHHPDTCSRLVFQIFGARAAAWLRSRDPALIISTYPLVTYVAATVFRDSAVGVINVVTDAGKLNRLWWQGRPHLTLVTHQDLLRQARDAGHASTRVHNIGLLADPRLSKVADAGTARARVGLRDAFTVLLAGGGLGFGPNLEQFARRLGGVATGVGAQFIVAAGSNAELRATIMSSLPPSSAIVCPATDMTDAVIASDLVIGKAGWLTISECITAGKPIIVLDSIPGQEDENIKFIERLGIGRRMSVASALEAFAAYAVNRELLVHDFFVNRELYHAEAGSYLAQLLMGVLQEVQGEGAVG